MDKYDPLQLVQDANTFAKSKFGQHYLERLAKAKQRELGAAMNLALSDGLRAHAATKAATVQAEMDYFDTAKKVQETPSLLKRLRKKLIREEEDEIV